MLREISAGGVVLQEREGAWWMAVIEPAEEAPKAGDPVPRAHRVPKPVYALPKGLVDPGEKALETALREVHEETGVIAEAVAKLGDIKYIYTRTWGGGERIFKIVSFYLMRYVSGRIDDVAREMRIEVARASWIQLEEAPKLLAYRGEKQMARKALEYVGKHPEL